MWFSFWTSLFVFPTACNQNLASAGTGTQSFSSSFYVDCFCFLLLATLVFNTNLRIEIHKHLIEILMGITLILCIDLEKTDVFTIAFPFRTVVHLSIYALFPFMS